jgi:hypothetical protein
MYLNGIFTSKRRMQISAITMAQDAKLHKLRERNTYYVICIICRSYCSKRGLSYLHSGLVSTSATKTHPSDQATHTYYSTLAETANISGRTPKINRRIESILKEEERKCHKSWGSYEAEFWTHMRSWTLKSMPLRDMYPCHVFSECCRLCLVPRGTTCGVTMFGPRDFINKNRKLGQ